MSVCLYQYKFLHNYLPINLPSYLYSPAYLLIHLCVYLSLTTSPFIFLHTYLPVYLPIYLLSYLPAYPSVCLSPYNYLAVYLVSVKIYRLHQAYTGGVNRSALLSYVQIYYVRYKV